MLRVDFPDFYTQLQDEPRLIEAFARVFRRHETPESIEVNETVQRIIRSYGTAIEQTAEKSADTRWRVIPEQEGLARYLASIDDLTWPLTLQPFLLLSQDRLARELGDDAQRVFNELVSGNIQGVYSALGQAYENAPLSARNAEFIQNLREQLVQQDQAPKERAFSVIAELRFPDSFRAQPLMIALAQQLIISQSLRHRIGLSRILALFPVVRAEERGALASELTREFLDLTVMFTANGRPLSLEAARVSVLELMRELLKLKTQERLPEKVEKAVLTWLADPRIGTKEDSETLAFQDLDQLFGEYEVELLPLLDSQYLRRFLIALKERELPSPLEPSLQRVSAALSRLVMQADHRVEAWDGAKSLLSSGQFEMASVGYTLALNHPEELRSPQLGELIGVLAEELIVDEDGVTPLPTIECDSHLLELVGQQKAGLTTSGLPPQLGPLILSRHDDAGVETALRLVDLMVAMDLARGREDPVTTEVLEEWTAHLTTDLEPAIAGHLLSKLLGQVAETHLTAVFTTLQNLFVRTGTPTSVEAQQFLSLMKMIPLKTLRSPAGVVFVEFALSWSTQQATSQLWISEILPVLVRLFEVAPAEARELLVAVNQAAIQNPVVLEALHKVMDGHWLSADAQVPAYDPAAIFDAAKAYMPGHASRPEAGQVLESMMSLQRTVFDAGSEPALSTAAFQLWPHDQETAGRVLQQLKAVNFSADRPAALLSNVEFSDAEERSRVEMVLGHVAVHMQQELRTKAALKLLERPVVVSSDDPDAELSSWVRAMGINVEATVLETVKTTTVTDPMAQRVWGAMIRHPELLTGESFKAWVVAAAERPWDSVLSSMSRHTNLLKAKIGLDDALAEQLLTLFQTSQSSLGRKQLAEIIESIVPDRYFKGDRVSKKLTDDDRTVLHGAGVPIRMPRRKLLSKSN